MSILTHDLTRKGHGHWRCVNCGAEGQTITEVNEKACPAQPSDNGNVLAAIAGTGKFKGDK